LKGVKLDYSNIRIVHFALDSKRLGVVISMESTASHPRCVGGSVVLATSLRNLTRRRSETSY